MTRGDRCFYRACIQGSSLTCHNMKVDVEMADYATLCWTHLEG